MAFVIPVIGAILNSVAAGGAAVAAGAGQAAGTVVGGVAQTVLPTAAGGGIATPSISAIGGAGAGSTAGSTASLAAANVGAEAGAIGSGAATASPVTISGTPSLVGTATSGATDIAAVPSAVTPAVPAGMSTATKIGIGLGALGVASGGVQAGLSVYQGNKRAQAVRDQARIAAGADELNTGKANQQALALASEISAGAASSGIDTSGSPLILTLDVLGKAREDAQQSRANSMARIRQAGREANAYETAGIIGGIGAGLGGALSGIAAGVKVA